ncbi:class I mannose-6-phosphate isomerase [Rathayibacter soli]|uniref:class I mannose-6-phosphate isomerase n=1 Tax=Rathayibacter soli TaxID=3144168 RepID=UPI0027E49B16|nr:class I mannose-6-phosphate isomerase [Glaciibacter superstes]
MSPLSPLRMPPAPIQHFYRGGDRLAALRGAAVTSDHQPEEWLASTTHRFGESDIGLSRTEDGALLRDLVAADPDGWVGTSDAGAGDVGVLVKLLDARQRLPVHVHPDRPFATSHLGCPYGKTEAWFVLDAEPGCAFYVGWRHPVDRTELDRRRDAQDGQWMLDNMNRIEARSGIGVVVPAGTVHAIDGGIFVAEVQEPTDFSILLEWSVTTSRREESHLDLGFDAAMQAVSTDAFGADRLAKITTQADPAGSVLQTVLASVADPFFRLRQAAATPSTGTDVVEAGFGVVLVTAGSGQLVGAGEPVSVERGEVYAVPAGFGGWHVEGDAAILVASAAASWPAGVDWPAGVTR